jgi:hypothetical protein
MVHEKKKGKFAPVLNKLWICFEDVWGSVCVSPPFTATIDFDERSASHPGSCTPAVTIGYEGGWAPKLL